MDQNVAKIHSVSLVTNVRKNIGHAGLFSHIWAKAYIFRPETLFKDIFNTVVVQHKFLCASFFKLRPAVRLTVNHDPNTATMAGEK